jgi:hypothetical protein
VDQVVGDTDPFQGRRQVFGMEDIAFRDLNPVHPAAASQPDSVPGKDPHRVSLLQEERDQPTAHITSGAGDKYSRF